MNEFSVSYKVYRSPKGKLIAVKQGFSWTAFIFSFVWAMYHRLWFLTIATFSVLLLINWTVEWSQLLVKSTALKSYTFMVTVLLGTIGNKALERKLLAQNYVLVIESRLDSAKEAITSIGK